jgi:putative FmdB family regulatory protein
MPSYDYRCDKCENFETRILKVSEYQMLKRQKNKCPECDKGVLSQQLALVTNKIERRKDEIVQQIEEEVNTLVNKVRSGDEKAIRDVYGDKPNPYKNK